MANAEPSKKVIKTPKPPVGRTGGLVITFNSLNVNKKIYSKKEIFQAQKAEKYQESLNKLPQRGGGLHSALLSCCNYGVIAGIPSETIIRDLLATGRPFKRGEIDDALSKALNEAGQTFIRSRAYKSCAPNPAEELSSILEKDKDKALKLQKRLISAGGKVEIADLWERSNPHPNGLPVIQGVPGSTCRADMITLLETLYNPSDYLYIGTRYQPPEQQAAHVKTAAEWISFFKTQLEAIQAEPNPREQYYALRRLGMNYSFFIPNPVNPTPDQEGSYRKEKCIADFRFIVCESDTLPLCEQLSIIKGLKMPVYSLVYTGNKSVHALIDAAYYNGGSPIKNREEWNKATIPLFKLLGSIGFDASTKNCNRLSRLPGVWRNESGDQVQKLLYINSNGAEF